ncbi:hypothetical protein D1007_17750 [Hordeum vulgare]|nr:hypothetical protein D1007_17750 [Hordeum vulgare]
MRGPPPPVTKAPIWIDPVAFGQDPVTLARSWQFSHGSVPLPLLQASPEPPWMSRPPALTRAARLHRTPATDQAQRVMPASTSPSSGPAPAKPRRSKCVAALPPCLLCCCLRVCVEKKTSSLFSICGNPVLLCHTKNSNRAGHPTLFSFCCVIWFQVSSRQCKGSGGV